MDAKVSHVGSLFVLKASNLMLIHLLHMRKSCLQAGDQVLKRKSAETDQVSTCDLLTHVIVCRVCRCLSLSYLSYTVTWRSRHHIWVTNGYGSWNIYCKKNECETRKHCLKASHSRFEKKVKEAINFMSRNKHCTFHLSFPASEAAPWRFLHAKL